MGNKPKYNLILERTKFMTKVKVNTGGFIVATGDQHKGEGMAWHLTVSTV
jgi:hypothetical protein